MDVAEGLSAEIDEAIRVIDALRIYARPEILKWFAPDSCIASTRVIFDLLRQYEMKPLAMACSVRVLNEALLKRIEKEGRHPVDDYELRRWSTQDGSWNVGIGRTGVLRKHRWDGHLVVLAYRKVLIDISIDQASRPRKGIVLKPLAVTAPDDWADGTTDFAIPEGRCALIYRAQPDNRDWVRTTGWTGHKDLRKQIVDRIALKVEKHLADN